VCRWLHSGMHGVARGYPPGLRAELAGASALEDVRSGEESVEAVINYALTTQTRVIRRMLDLKRRRDSR
jgi:hypothetical protein